MKTAAIRIRLTFWYFAMFATAACLLSIASWWMLQRSVDATEYHDLQERAEDVQLLLLNEDPNRSIDELRQDFTQIYSIKDDGKWLQVADQDGRWIYRSRRMIAENPELPRPEQLPKMGVIAEFHQGTRYVRILAYPIQVRDKKYSVQTGIALNKSMALLKSFGADLLLLTPAMILFASLGGHWMSRKALRPVALLAAEARCINDRNLDRRLPVPQTQDEISDLSNTLNQMLERIDKAFASVRAFTGNASHELRTPITLLRTEIEVALIRPRDGEEYRATLSHLHHETVLMTRLVENLLSIARADAGAERVNLQPIDLNDLFHRMDRDWIDSMHLAGLDFRTEIGNEQHQALGDPSTLPRLLSILLENARKYTPAGGSVVLSAVNESAGIRIAVQDTGVGISQKDLPRIFDRFFRGEQAGIAESSGSGLGLALGKWIAERHGTELVVASSPGCGSSFSFTLLRATPAPLKRASLPYLLEDEEEIQA
ncbi:sensor histidine kinase [Acidicapsa dinghuensis]|uniref:histidine kinase n=2 Tax=Acidicapsa dinghuensis TaxID=2218256 RepID=A0ABW1EH07_9BACT|nr:ATP-binding protein [Acidicapsa dinghuensis]